MEDKFLGVIVNTSIMKSSVAVLSEKVSRLLALNQMELVKQAVLRGMFGLKGFSQFRVSAAPARLLIITIEDKRGRTAAIIRRNSALADQRFHIIAQKG